MQTPLEIAFQHIDPSNEIKSLVEEKAADLERFYDGITSCHVYIRAPHQSKGSGHNFEITLEVRVPGKELVVRSGEDDLSGDVHLPVIVRDAFATMAMRLKDWRAQIGGDVKSHSGMLQGLVVEIHQDRDFGQIIAADGRLIYFHRNSVVDGNFDELQPRDAVELVVQSDESETGPQASTVRTIASLEYDPTRKPSRR